MGNRQGQVLAVLGLVLVAATAVRAGDHPRTPQAISPVDVTRYADILGLSSEQRFAVEGMHERYLDEVEPLRLEMMEMAMRHPVRFGVPDGDEMIAHLPGFIARMRSVDESFFSAIEPLLTPAQVQELPRVRLLRERSLYARLGAVAWFIGDSIPDLSVLLADLDVPAEVSESLRPSLIVYEDRLTRGMRGIYEAVVRLCGEGDDRAAHLLIERVRSLRAMNRRTFGEIARSLPEPYRRRLAVDFRDRAYHLAFSSTQAHMLPRLEVAAASPDLADDERELLIRMRDELRSMTEERFEELAQRLDEDAIDHAEAPGARPRQWDLDAFNDARQAILEREFEVRRTLREKLGEERAAAIKSLRLDDDDVRRIYVSASQRRSCSILAHPTFVRRPIAATVAERRYGDPYLAEPITTHELEKIALLLGLDDEQQAILREVHRAYSEDLREPHERLRRLNMEAQMFIPDESEEDRRERRSRQWEVRDEMRSLIVSADEAFFDDLRDALEIDADDLRLKRLRSLRKRAAHQMITMVGDRFDQNRAAEVDLVALLIRLGLVGDEWDDVREVVDEYEARCMELLRARLDSLPRTDPARLLQQGQMEELRRQGEKPHTAHLNLTQANAAYAMSVAEALPTATADRFLAEFSRRAYPLAHEDPASMEHAIAQAARLPDLTDDQRGQIAEIRAEFAAAYDGVRSEIIELCAAYEPNLVVPLLSFSSTPERVAMDERFTQMMEKLSDERAAVNRRALRGLRTALTPAQLRRLDLPQID